MKTLAFLLTISAFFIANTGEKHDAVGFQKERHVTSCPPNHALAEKELKEYLHTDSVIEELHRLYDMSNLTMSSYTEMIPLDEERHQETCKILIDLNSQWLKNSPEYSLYQVDNYYFIVGFSIDDEGEFERKTIVIIDEGLEAVGFVPNWP